MAIENQSVFLSVLDEQRFGIRTVRARLVTIETLSEIMDFCRSNGVVLLIGRCSTADLRTVQEMEQKGFLLMDTLIYYQCNLSKVTIPKKSEEVTIRSIRKGEEGIIRTIAAQSFHEYRGHYHADPRLDPDKCDEAYESWAYNMAISNLKEGERIVAELDGSVVGFSFGKINNPEEYEGILSCVKPGAQRSGIYRDLIIHRMLLFKSIKINRFLVSTQLINIASQKSWSRLGFVPSHSYYTFHKWFD